jgi:hypothetical protein
MPRIVRAGRPVTVVQSGSLRIDELAGNAASNDDAVSIARVVVSDPNDTEEPYVTIQYDEWLCVVQGRLEVRYKNSSNATSTTKDDGDDDKGSHRADCGDPLLPLALVRRRRRQRSSPCAPVKRASSARESASGWRFPHPPRN